MVGLISAGLVALSTMGNLPIEVTKDVEYAREICRSLGAMFTFDERHTDQADFNQDGVPDYLIDARGYNCGKQTDAMFGGSAGKPIYLYLSTPDKHWKKVFNGYAFEYNIKEEYGQPPYFDVWIRGEVGYQVNYQRFQWNGEEMEIVDQEMGVDVPEQLWKEFD